MVCSVEADVVLLRRQTNDLVICSALSPRPPACSAAHPHTMQVARCGWTSHALYTSVYRRPKAVVGRVVDRRQTLGSSAVEL